MSKDTKFKPGKSGNPNGRPKGSSRAADLRQLLNPDAEALVQKAKELALSGDVTALRLCLERLVPVIKIKDEPIIIEGLDSDSSLAEQGKSVIKALSLGDITPSESTTVMQTIANQARIIEVDEHDKRLTELEAKHDSSK